MNPILEDEITSINAIYEPDTLSTTSSKNELILQIMGSQISLRIAFPESYPDAVPLVIGPHSVGAETRKGEAHDLVQLTTSVLKETFIPGEPCIYDLMESLASRIANQRNEANAEEIIPKHEPEPTEDTHDTNGDLEAMLNLNLNLNLNWTLSVPVTEKKSIFIARAIPVTDPTLASTYLQHLLHTDKKVSKATHNITAWRIKGGIATYQDCNDDGETAAGGRLLHLMQIMDVWDVMVVVSRWYGGVQLGPDRFRIINQVARNALVRGGWGKVEEEKRRGHK